MPLPGKWFRDFKDRIIYAIVFVMGCGFLCLGFSGGSLVLLCAGAAAMFLSWRAWEEEWEYVYWFQTRSKHGKAGAAEHQNKYPSDVSPAGESSDYDSGPHFTYDLGRRPLSFSCSIPSEKPPSAKSSWIKAIILGLLAAEQLELMILVVLIAFGAVMLLVMAGSIYLTATYPIAVFAIGFVILFALYFRDKLCLKKRRSAQSGRCLGVFAS